MSYQFGKGLAQPEQFLDVDTHFFKMGRSTPLLLSWRSGAHTTAKAMIEDVLTIRADSDLAAAQKIHVYLNVFHDPLIDLGRCGFVAVVRHLIFVDGHELRNLLNPGPASCKFRPVKTDLVKSSMCLICC